MAQSWFSAEMSKAAVSDIVEGGLSVRHGGKPRSFAALDGWRGVCAIFVALLHFPLASHITSNALVANSHLFVDFFFVLSGFVLSHAYLTRLRGVGDAKLMVWRRLGRLWPLHVALLGAFVALELSVTLIAALSGYQRSSAGAFDPASASTIAAIPTNILMLQGMGVHDRLTWNEPSWSVSVEFWVAIVFAGAVVLARRWMTPIALGLAVFGAIAVITASTDLMDTTYDLGFFRCLYGFFTGYLVHQIVLIAPLRGKSSTIVEAAAVILVFAFVAGLSGTTFEFAAPIVFAGCVWVFASESGAVSSVLMTRPLQLVGLWSYSIYMVHSLVIAVLERGAGLAAKMWPGLRTFTESGDLVTMDALALVYIAGVIGISAIAWRWLEMPAQRYWNGALWRKVMALNIASSASVSDHPAAVPRR